MWDISKSKLKFYLLFCRALKLFVSHYGQKEVESKREQRGKEDIWTQEKVTKDWKKIHNKYLYDIHFPPNTEPIIRSRRIRHVHMG